MNNDKNIQPRNRNKAAKDPLRGAPGHSEDLPETTEPKAALNVRKAGEDIADENHKASSSTVDEVLAQLGSTFGESNVKKFRDLLSSKAADAETKIMDMVRSFMGSLPKDFSLPNMSAIKSRPVTSAATVATGVGALFLLREYLTRDSGAGETQKSPKAPRKKVAGADRNPSSTRQMSAAKGGQAKGSSKAKAQSSKTKSSKGKTSKSKTASSGKSKR